MIARHLKRTCALLVGSVIAISMAGVAQAEQTKHESGARPIRPIRVLFLGDNGHHKPVDRAAQLIPQLHKRGIEVTYTNRVEHLNPGMLNQYDGLIIYANLTVITREQEKALLEYVQGGGGFVPIHCASYCFLNSPKYVALVGAQFKRHNAGVFSVKATKPDHPILKDFKGFESWDETYVHTKHNESDRTVLQTRSEGDSDEPWTWVRKEGKGRVFYTAWGHDHRTWGNPQFVELIDRGIRWATEPRVSAGGKEDSQAFKYIKSAGPIPNYKAGASWGTQEKPIGTMQAPMDAEASARRIVTPPGLKAKLFAAEPNIRPTLAMAWDARGRLWLCESADYPNNLQPPGKGRDTIRICEDTDNDGKADKFTVFADNLSIPSAITFSRGGVIVQVGTQTLFLKDTDGDDKADVRKVIIDGWDLGDTHGGVSNFTYGHDNWIWAMQGYNKSTPRFGKQLEKRSQTFRMGFFRFKLDREDSPNVTALEFIRSTNNNSWGLGLSEEGLVFGSTANRNPSDFMPIANRYYERVRGWAPASLKGIANHHLFYPISPNVRQVDHHGGFTAGAGHRLYTARTYPREYWNRVAFVCGPTGKLAGTYVLRPDGAAFKSSNDWNIAASDDEWFSPIAADVGPDGCVWLVDWYNYVIQHNPTPVGFKRGKGAAYESVLRDKKHGRIYRIVPEDHNRLPKPLRLENASPSELVAALRNENMFWRQHAQRLLVERGDKDVIPALIELANDTQVDAIGLNVGVIHALRTMQGLGAFEGNDSASVTTAIRALRHPSAGVRRTAALALPSIDDTIDAILAADLLNDSDSQVRLAALLALADAAGGTASDRAGAAILAMLKQPRNANDPWITDAATAAAANNDAGFLRAVLNNSQSKRLAAKDDIKPSTQTLKNLLSNTDLDNVQGTKPQNWRAVSYIGDAVFSIGKGEGRSGSNAFKITAKSGTDASWTQDVTVKPKTRYRLSAWIKTQDFKKGPGLGALLNLHQLQQNGKTNAVSADADWTRVSSEFESGDNTTLSVNLLMGGWGMCAGTAWWDDVELFEIGSSGNAIAVGLSPRVGTVVNIVTRHYADRAPADSVVQTLGSLKGADQSLITFVLDGLVAGWPKGKAPKLDDADRAELAAVMKALPKGHRDRLITLAQRWGHEGLFTADIESVITSLREAVSKTTLSANERIDSGQRLIRLADTTEHASLLLKQITPQASSELASGLVNALAGSRLDDTATVLIKHWASLTPSARRAGVAILKRRTPWTHAMLSSIRKGDIHKVDLSSSDWQFLKVHQDKTIAAQSAKLDADRGDADRGKVLEKMLPYLDAKANLHAGATVFQNLCTKCHRINGKGGVVGPDLTGVGSRQSKDILAEIIDPNRSVESNFRLWIIETEDGDMLTGRLDTETKTSVELLDLEGKRHVVDRRNIYSMRASPLSIMPVGLIDQLPAKDVASLIAFLKQSTKHSAH